MIVVKLEVIIIMDIKFSKVAKASLSSVPIVNGQIIVLTDSDEIYYDMNSTRRRASSKATASNYGIVKLTDSYATSAGAAAGSVGASSKAVADMYASLVDDMNWTYLIGTGTNVHYNRTCLRIRVAVSSYSQSAGTSVSTSILLPSNIKANMDMYIQGYVLNSGWHPINATVYMCIKSGSSAVEVRTSTTLSNNVILGDAMFPRGLFTIS